MLNPAHTHTEGKRAHTHTEGKRAHTHTGGKRAHTHTEGKRRTQQIAKDINIEIEEMTKGYNTTRS